MKTLNDFKMSVLLFIWSALAFWAGAYDRSFMALGGILFATATLSIGAELAIRKENTK